MDLARNIVFLGIPSLQFVPSLNSLILLKYVRVDLDETQEGFVVSTVVDVDADFGMFSKNITVRLYEQKVRFEATKDAYKTAS